MSEAELRILYLILYCSYDIWFAWHAYKHKKHFVFAMAVLCAIIAAAICVDDILEVLM